MNSRKILFKILNLLKENNSIQDYVFYTTKFLGHIDIIHLLYYDLFVNLGI